MENVNNRSLFRNRSGAARDKVRQMGMVREPQGILSSFPELMNAAGRNRPQNGMMQQPMMQPQMMQPQMMRMPQGMQQQPMMQPQRMEMSPMMQSPMMQQQPPTRFQDGGAVEPSFMERVGQNAMLATGMSMPTQRFDIAATPTPRARVEVPDISTMIKENIGDNPEAQEKLAELEGALDNPDATPEDRKTALTDAFGAPDTKDGLRDVVTKVTGREPSASATVDELNNAISGVALGGAIGGPRSAAARISEALLLGLQAKRETATERESFGQELAIAGAKAKPKEVKGFLETPRGEAALEMYNEFLSQEFSPEQAYARINEVTPGLGSELNAAMSGAAAKPLTDVQENDQGVRIGWDGSQWVDEATRQPYQQ
jgi:hypothetical protein